MSYESNVEDLEDMRLPGFFSPFSGDSDVSDTEEEWFSHRHLMLHDLSGELEGGLSEFKEAMDGALWRKLPEDLLERVLQKLPMRCLCRFRSVCSRWRSVLSSESFLRLSSPGGPFISAFEVLSSLEDVPREATTSVCKVYRIDLSFVPKKIFSVATSHKGLICFSTYPKNCSTVSLCVCNPITRTWRALPEFTIPVTHAWEAAMVVDGRTNSLKVIVISDDMHIIDADNENIWTFHEYCSDRDAWRVIQGDESRGTFLGDPFLLCRELVYSLDDVDVQLYNTTVDGKLVKKLDIQTPSEVFSHARLMECHGDVLLVGDILASSNLTVGIWKLDEGRVAWECVSVFPEEQRRDMARGWGLENCHVELVNGITVGHVICLEIDIYHHNKKVGLQYVLAYDTQEDVWVIYHMKSVRDRAMSLEHQDKMWHTFPTRRVTDKGLTLIEPNFSMVL